LDTLLPASSEPPSLAVMGPVPQVRQLGRKRLDMEVIPAIVQAVAESGASAARCGPCGNVDPTPAGTEGSPVTGLCDHPRNLLVMWQVFCERAEVCQRCVRHVWV
jgi:hypothetical protein